MTEPERFMVDDAGTLIDKKTAECYDYMEEILPILNSQEETIERMKCAFKRKFDYDIEEVVAEICNGETEW